MSCPFWCWFLPFVELVVVVVALTDNEAGVKVPWFWILLLLLASIGLLGAGASLVRLDRPEGDDLPRSGCLPLIVWSVFAFLSLAFVVVSIVWLAGGADSAGSRWTLLPIVAAMLLGGLGAWMVRASRGSVGAVDARGIAAATTVFLSLLGIVALLWWFVGGSRSIETLGDAGTETVVQPAPEEPEVADEVPDTGATTDTESPVITDTPPVEVEDPIVVPETPVDTPLHPDVATLISRWCVTNMSDANADLTMETLFSEPTRATGPVEGDMYPRAENPPAAVDIDYVGVASGGCDGQPKIVVIASLGGPPSDVQLSLAIDLPDTAGHAAEPTSSDGIALISGWDEFVAYEAGAGADGIFQSDGNFAPVPTTAMVDMEGNNFAFIVDQPSDVSSIDFILQAFYRMGVTESDPILWNTATITYSR